MTIAVASFLISWNLWRSSGGLRRLESPSNEVAPLDPTTMLANTRGCDMAATLPPGFPVAEDLS